MVKKRRDGIDRCFCILQRGDCSIHIPGPIEDYKVIGFSSLVASGVCDRGVFVGGIGEHAPFLFLNVSLTELLAQLDERCKGLGRDAGAGNALTEQNGESGQHLLP
jgi:hypothetical protein